MTMPVDSGLYRRGARMVQDVHKGRFPGHFARLVYECTFVGMLLTHAALAGAAPVGLAVDDHAKRAQEAPLRIERGAFPGRPAWSYVSLEPDLTRADIVVVHRRGGAFLTDLVPKDAWAAINGGYWLADYSPTGWVRDRFRELKPKAKGAKGGVLAISGTKVFIGSLAQLSFTPEFAVQNSPELVMAGGKLAAFRPDVRRASRTIACRMRAASKQSSSSPNGA